MRSLGVLEAAGNGNTGVGFAALTASSGGGLNTALGRQAGHGHGPGVQ